MELTNKDYYYLMPEDIRVRWSLNIINARDNKSIQDFFNDTSRDFCDFMNKSFSWSSSNEGFQYWLNLIIYMMNCRAYPNGLITNIVYNNLINKHNGIFIK